MLTDTDVAQVKLVHGTLEGGLDYEATAAKLDLTVDQVKHYLRLGTGGRYRRYLKAKSLGLDSTKGL